MTQLTVERIARACAKAIHRGAVDAPKLNPREASMSAQVGDVMAVVAYDIVNDDWQIGCFQIKEVSMSHKTKGKGKGKGGKC